MKAAIRCTIPILVMMMTSCDDLGLAQKNQVKALQEQVTQLRKDLEQAKTQQTSRWHIEMRPGVRADTYLIDTDSGRVWREYLGSGKTFWQETPRSDRPWLADNAIPSKYSPDVEQTLAKWVAAGWSRPDAINQLKRRGIIGLSGDEVIDPITLSFYRGIAESADNKARQK